MLLFQQILGQNKSLMSVDKSLIQAAVLRIAKKDAEQPGLEILNDQGKALL